jgi:DNA-directed RNA polymerase subunit RPC12/RpoP
MAHIPFFCAVCGASLRADLSLAGGVLPCVKCERSVPVPGFPLGSPLSGCVPVFPPEILEMDMTFLCVGCDTRLVVDARMEGRDLECPRCQVSVRAPRWSGLGDIAAAVEANPGASHLSPEEVQFLSTEPFA